MPSAEAWPRPTPADPACHGHRRSADRLIRAVRRLYRDGALADGRSDRLRLGVSILVEDGRITWIRPSDDEGPVADPGGLEVVDASGSTIVPGLVDAHSHLTMPGGAHWIDRASDPTESPARRPPRRTRGS